MFENQAAKSNDAVLERHVGIIIAEREPFAFFIMVFLLIIQALNYVGSQKPYTLFFLGLFIGLAFAQGVRIYSAAMLSEYLTRRGIVVPERRQNKKGHFLFYLIAGIIVGLVLIMTFAK